MSPRATSCWGRPLRAIVAALVLLSSLAAIGRPAEAHHLVGDVPFGMPFAGRFGNTNWDSYPGQHWAPAGGDFGMDLYAPAGTEVRVIAPGASVLQVDWVQNACQGKRVRVNVFQNGQHVGWLHYSHLVDVPAFADNQQIPSGQVIGRTSQFPFTAGCWEVRTAEGVHVHFEAYNNHNFSCWTPHASHTPLPEGNTIGALGGTGRSTGACPAPPTNRIVSIKSLGNNRYVAAEFGYGGNENGMLRAARAGVYGWEQFRLVGDCNVGCGIQSVATGRYVSAELGFSGGDHGMLRARHHTIEGWERFRLVGDCNWGCGIQSVANGRYVSAELGYGGHRNGMLRARATARLGWETFTIQGR